MSNKKPKTQGLEWLVYSIISFNGSGYADRTDANSFLESYRDYKLWKGQPDAAALLDEHWYAVVPTARELLQGPGPGHTPSQASWLKFNRFRNRG